MVSLRSNTIRFGSISARLMLFDTRLIPNSTRLRSMALCLHLIPRTSHRQKTLQNRVQTKQK
jgi:hypothetical protein